MGCSGALLGWVEQSDNSGMPPWSRCLNLNQWVGEDDNKRIRMSDRMKMSDRMSYCTYLCSVMFVSRSRRSR